MDSIKARSQREPFDINAVIHFNYHTMRRFAVCGLLCGGYVVGTYFIGMGQRLDKGENYSVATATNMFDIAMEAAKS